MVILAQGLDKLISRAEENVEWSFGDIVREGVEGIGTSDVSICIMDILKDLDIDKDEVSDIEWQMMRNLVHNKINELGSLQPPRRAGQTK